MAWAKPLDFQIFSPTGKTMKKNTVKLEYYCEH